MYFRKEREAIPFYQDLTVEGDVIHFDRLDHYEPGPTHFFINGEEVPEDEYEYFYNAQYKDDFKEKNV